MGSKNTILIYLTLIVFLTNFIVCPPLNPHPVADKEMEEEKKTDDDPILALEYHKYLREIVNVLETDPNFKKVIEGASADDIKSGKIASNLDLVAHNVRTKLDELKRQEIERLRKLISRKVALSNLKPDDIEKLLPKHVDHNNIETFEVNDLEKLIRQATVDLEEVDRIRREEFKQHELQKEYERRKKLEKLDPEMRKRLQEEHDKELDQKKHHEKINHPGSKDQLEEVWEKQDHLEPNQFNPKTFFELHDIDNNKFLDQNELEAIFATELDKIHNPNDPDYDPVERSEEASRMREHVFKEIDTDKDKMISMDEFINATGTKEFEKNEEWRDVDDEPQFNQQEFENFSRAHMEAESTRAPMLSTPAVNINVAQNQNPHVNNVEPLNKQQPQQDQIHH